MRLYRLLLRLYPASFRGEYADEMQAIFDERTRAMSPARRAIAAIADAVPSAIAAHADILQADLRHTARTLRRSPAFAVTAILVVALGVGANTAAFSVADFVLIRPLPFPHAEQLVKLWQTTPGYATMELSPANYRDWKASSRSFEAMGAYTLTAANVTGAGEPQRVRAAAMTLDAMRALGVKPILGRLFAASDTLDRRAVVVSAAFWRRQFGGDPGIVGKPVEIDGASATVIGVMPDAFNFPRRDVALWRPLAFGPGDFEDRADNYLQVVARLRPDVTVEQAGAELSLIARRLEQQFPEANEKTGARTYRLSDEISDRSRILILALCGAALCVLLLACANLANLLIARAAAHERELAVRAALGAGRERIVRQIVTESLVVALLGGAAGVLVAVAGVPALARLIPTNLPIAEQPAIDPRVLVFALLLVVVTSLAFSVGPALRASAVRGLGSLREDARSGSRQRTRSALIVVEVMASVVLLISSGLLVRAIWRLQSVDPGFRVEHVLTMRTALPWPRYADPKTRAPFYDKVLGEIRALPGVQSAAYISYLPMVMRGGIWPVSVQGNEVVRGAANSASLRFATPQIFDALGVPLESGRAIEPTDRLDGMQAAVVSASFAKRYWPNEPALGKHFRMAFKERTVVGIVGDIRVRGLEQQSEPQVYLPYTQQDSGSLITYTPQDLVIRATSAPEQLMPAVRRIIHDADVLQPISDVQTMEEIVAGETASRAAQLRVLVILAAIALILSAVGIHGLLSFTVSRRRREIGVRMALGAQAGEVRRMIIREGLTLAVAGVVPGIALAYAAGRAMQSILVGVSPHDAATFATASLICAAAVLGGCFVPALRAAAVDPMEAIRAE